MANIVVVHFFHCGEESKHLGQIITQVEGFSVATTMGYDVDFF